VNVEANTVIEMAKTIIYPAAMRYQGELADTAAKLKAAGLEADTTVLEKVTGLAKGLLVGVGKVESALHHGVNGSVEGHAKHSKKRFFRLCSKCAPQQTPLKVWWPTTSGRCQLTRKCFLSSKPASRINL
jgi:glutamine synthetase type III